jgi:hypothetical protein
VQCRRVSKLLWGVTTMNELIVLIQGGLLGIAALNLLFAVWLMYRQVGRETTRSRVGTKPTSRGSSQSGPPSGTASLTPQILNLRQ